MSEQSATYEFIGEIAKEQLNGKQEVKAQVVDSRIRLDVDPKRVRAWEVAVLQSGNFENTMMIFARYLSQNGKRVSPELSDKPLHKLTGAEKSQIKNSKAYELLEMFDLPTLQAASLSFVNQANDFGNDPN